MGGIGKTAKDSNLTLQMHHARAQFGDRRFGSGARFEGGWPVRDNAFRLIGASGALARNARVSELVDSSAAGFVWPELAALILQPHHFFLDLGLAFNVPTYSVIDRLSDTSKKEIVVFHHESTAGMRVPRSGKPFATP
jgi:hypothetical protein